MEKTHRPRKVGFLIMGAEQPQQAEGHVRTDHPGRYLARLREWAGTAGSRPQPERLAEWSDTHGTIDFESGRCTLQTGPDALTLRVEAADRNGLRRIQRLITERLRETGGPDAPPVTWQPAVTVTPHPRHRTKLGIAAVVVLVVAAHLGLGGLLLASGPWKHWALAAVLAALLAKTAYMLRRRTVRRGQARQAR
ncbi:DUF2218 domain-containing protein [Actinacidiphila glaucinigra]|uniref:DUF2218 domain-containing protein n=1 Tax=Actinacidiphila glaucinigra TaxID=235986 RepID=UPI0035DF5543